MNNRRVQMAAMASVFLPGCMLQPKAPVDEAAQKQASIDQKLKEKFRGISFYEFDVTKLHDLGSYENALPVIYLPNGRTIAQTTPAGQHYEISDRRPVPTHLKLVWHAKGSRFRPNNEYLKPPLPIFEGEIQGEITFPVAERIPDDLLDDLRRDPRGTLRIKVRLHRDGVLLGWDIERRPNPWGVTPDEIEKQNLFIPMAWSHTGGDFKEARPAFYVWDQAGFKGLPAQIPVWTPAIGYGPPYIWRWQNFISLPAAQRLGGTVPKEWADQGLFITSAKDKCCETRVKGALYERGWYIHPKTGQRIETDL